MNTDECCVCYENVEPISRHTIMDFKCQFCNDGILCSDCKCKIVDDEDVVICPICRIADYRDVMVMVRQDITSRFPTVSPRVEKFLQDINKDDDECLKPTPPVFDKLRETLNLYPTDWYLEIWSAYFVMDIMLRLGYCAI